jgi:hypothetical protein
MGVVFDARQRVQRGCGRASLRAPKSSRFRQSNDRHLLCEKTTRSTGSCWWITAGLCISRANSAAAPGGTSQWPRLCTDDLRA